MSGLVEEERKDGLASRPIVSAPRKSPEPPDEVPIPPG